MAFQSIATPSEPSVKSTTTKAFFSDRTKVRLKTKYGGRCWVCKAFPTTFAHVISKSDDQFTTLKDFGIIDFATLGDESNAILLCPLCHFHFDSPTPNLVIAPSDLEWFITWETKDRRHRIAEHKSNGIMPKRISPTAKDYAQHSRKTNGDEARPMYTQYIRDDYFPVLHDRQPLAKGTLASRPWDGSPTAMIKKALGATLMPIGLPKDLVKALDRLKTLWFVDDPALGYTDGDSGGGGVGEGLQSRDLGNNSEDSTAHPPERDLSSNNQGSRGGRAVTVTGTAATSTPQYLLSDRWQVPFPPPDKKVNTDLSELARWESSVTSRSSQTSDGGTGENVLPLPGNPKGWRWGPSRSAQTAINYYIYQHAVGPESI